MRFYLKYKATIHLNTRFYKQWIYFYYIHVHLGYFSFSLLSLHHHFLKKYLPKLKTFSRWRRTWWEGKSLTTTHLNYHKTKKKVIIWVKHSNFHKSNIWLSYRSSSLWLDFNVAARRFSRGDRRILWIVHWKLSLLSAFVLLSSLDTCSRFNTCSGSSLPKNMENEDDKNHI